MQVVFERVCKYRRASKSEIMNLIMLHIASDTLYIDNQLTGYTFYNNIIFWVFLAILFIVIFLYSMFSKKRKKEEFTEISREGLKKLKNEKVDMNDLMDSINNSKELYRTLSAKCHPDKFVNSTKHQIAEDLFKEIAANKRNFKQLENLKARAITELGITA
jgi:predicted membrane protein